MASKTGPLTKSDFVTIWQSAMDRGYWQPLSDAGLGGGYEAWDQAFDQAAAVSQEIDTVTQGLYINPHSSQTAAPASGAVQATVSLTLKRANIAVNQSMTLPAGQMFAERQTDASPTGGVIVFTGRQYFIPEVTFAPGEQSKSVTATAERPGLGGNYPQANAITSVMQVGQNRSASGANIIQDGVNFWLQVVNQADTVIPQNVGSYVLVTGGSLPAGGARCYVKDYAGPNVSASDGGRLKLAERYSLEFFGLTGTFQDGEKVIQGTSTGTLKRFYNPGSGKYYLTIEPQTINDTFAIASTDIIGVTSGAHANTATLAIFIESPVLSLQSNVSWSIQDMVSVYGLTSTNPASPTGGRPGQLDDLGANHNIRRGPQESDTAYRGRLSRVPDVVSPNAIRRAVNVFLTAANYAGCTLREPGLSTWPTFYADNDAADYDQAARSYADYWKVAMSYSEYRAFFDVELPPMQDGDFGVFYDVTTIGVNAYDVLGYLSFNDGYAWTAAQRRRAIWSAVNQARAGGVSFDMSETPFIAFTPPSLSGLTAWWRSDLLIGLGASGQRAQFWGDSSGNGNLLAQSNANNRENYVNVLTQPFPYLQTSGAGGTSDLHKMSLSSAIDLNTGAVTYTAVFTAGALAGIQGGYVFSDSTGSTDSLIDAYPGTGLVTWLNNQGASFAGNPDVVTCELPGLGIPVVVTVVQTDGVSASMYMNGTLVASWVPTHSAANSGIPQLLNVMGGSSGFGMNGHFMETIIYNRALPADDITRLHAYLLDRYNITEAAPFSPRQLSGLVDWHRADMGFTVSSGAVAAWNDQSLTGDANKTQAQANVSLQPTLNASNANYNGKPTVDYSTTSDLFSGTWTTPPPVVGTTFIVGNSDGTAAPRLFLDGISADRFLFFQNSATQLLAWRGNNLAWNGATPAVKHIYGIDWNGPASAIYQDAITAVATGNTGSDNAIGITMGNQLNGSIAEVIIYNRILTTAERTQVLNYLGHRYGVNIGL